jgi:small ligand-binding sensory domain FIST
MAVRVAVGVSDQLDPVEAFASAARTAALDLGERCDLAVVFASPQHLEGSEALLEAVHAELEPRGLIGCGAGGVLGAGREFESGPGAVVWALAAPDARIATHYFDAPPPIGNGLIEGLPSDEELGEALVVLADPYTFSAEALLATLNDRRPGMPVLGGLASAAASGATTIFRDREVMHRGAVAATLADVGVIPCVSQGATPIGPEMTITAAHGNVIEGLASRPAIERLREAIADLPTRESRRTTSTLRRRSVTG